MPIGHGPRRALTIRALAFAIDCVAPVSIAYTLYRSVRHFFYGGFQAQAEDGSRTWTAWMYNVFLPTWLFFETAFFVWMILQRKKFQASSEQPALDKDRRRFMVNRMLQTISEARFPTFFACQFMWTNSLVQLTPEEVTEIRLDNVKDWIAWALYAKRSWNDLLVSEPDGEHLAEEAEAYIHLMLSRKGITVRRGFNRKIKAVTLYHNPVEAFAKPLLMYAFVAGLERASHCLLNVLGFRRYRAQRTDICNDMPKRGITYWLRTPKAKRDNGSVRRRRREETDLPIVFVHGLGGGLWCYIKFILKMWYTQRTRPIYLVELPHVSMRFKRTAPDPDQTVHELSAMLRRHGHDSATFVAHSLGTAYAAYMINHSKMVAGAVMIDPICFNIYDANLLYNFVYRKPGAGGKEVKANEFLVHWLVARELYISQWISRQFVWHRSHLLPASLPAQGSTSFVFLAEKDNIIDAPIVAEYLKNHGVQYKMYEKLDHAQFLLQEKEEWEILEKIGAISSKAGREWCKKERSGERRRRRTRR